MNFFYNIILNFILLFFPLLVYLILKTYILKPNKNDSIYFFITMSISILLLLIFGKINFFDISIIIVLPILFTYIKKNKYPALILSILLIAIYNLYFQVNLYLLILEYITYFVSYIIFEKKEMLTIIFINNFIIIRSFFLSFYLFYLYLDKDFNINIIYLIITIITTYFISLVYYHILRKKITLEEYEYLKSKIDTEDNLKNYLCAITHELKNSLTISKGYLDIMNKKKKDEYLKIIKKEVNRSIDIIQDGLNLSKDKINYEILDVNVLLEDVITTLKDLLKNKKIKYRMDYYEDDIYILGDYQKLKQVVINMIKNSIESKDKDLYLEIKSDLIKKNICISIKDNGCGIKDIEQIGKGYSSKINGMGIGTIFSKNIISKHNGELLYESIKNEGTTVKILLPVFK